MTDSQAGLASTAADGLVLKSAAGRWVLLASILGSGLAGIDATVVNVALPAIGREFGAAFGALQWVITAYTLTLASLILLGGALGDRYGRRRVFIIGVIWFAAASLICGVAPSAGWLIAARALQGIGGALLTPGSLAMIQASFAPADRSRAIGAWSGLGGVATAVGPFVGGWLIQAASWRWVFIINAPLALLVVLIAQRHVPETRDPFATGRVDVLGALLSAAGLAGITYAIIAAPEVGISSPAVLISGGLGVLAMVGFLFAESRIRFPMLPLSMFKVRQFSAANAVTFAVYAGFGGVFFLLAVQLQVIGFSPIAAGTALLPITVVMLLLSARFGALAARIGPRIPMTVGPLICAAGTLLMLRIGPGATYLVDVLPAVLVLGFGLSLLVAPLTATVLASVGAEHAGVASGVNNAVARAAALIAVAALPAVSGLSGASYDDPSAFTRGFRMSLLIAVGLLIIGAGIAAATIRANPLSVSPAVPPQPQPAREALVPARAAELQRTSNRLHCAVDGPPLCPQSRV